MKVLTAQGSNLKHVERQHHRIGDLVHAVVHFASEESAQLLYFGWIPKTGGWSRLLAVIGRPKHALIEWHHAAPTFGQTAYPSLSARWPAALWLEREMWELTKVLPVGHPDLRAILHPETQEERIVVHGDEVFQLPLGPVRSDVVESMFMRFDTQGEQVVHMQPELFYKHRDIERLAVGLPYPDGRFLAERVAGTSTIAHATAYARAIEHALGHVVHPKVEQERIVFGEWERIYNHAHDMAQMASAAGMTVAQAQLSRVKEECLRVNGDLCGSRYLRNAVLPCKASDVEWAQVVSTVIRRLRDIDGRFTQCLDLLRRTPTFVDRFVGAGIVKQEWARAYGTVGPVARACGQHVDVREDYMRDRYEQQAYRAVVDEAGTGDGWARFVVRAGEWEISQRVLTKGLQLLANGDFMEAGSLAGTQDDSKNDGFSLERTGIGLSESPRGRVCHVVQLDPDGRLAFWGIRAASAWNWPVLGLAVANGNIQQDFPPIEASFGLSCAGVDR